MDNVQHKLIQKSKDVVRNLSYWHFIHQKAHMNSTETKPRRLSTVFIVVVYGREVSC